MWWLRGEPLAEVVGVVGRGRTGSFVFQRLNVEFQLLFKRVWGKRAALTTALHQQYIKPFPQLRDGQAIPTLARSVERQ